jgi:hypothetical protein
MVFMRAVRRQHSGSGGSSCWFGFSCWIQRIFSNHSLRAIAATRLFDADVDEQLIMAKTGHASSAVRNYERISDEKLSNVTNIVSGKYAKCNSLHLDSETDVLTSGITPTATRISCDGRGVNITLNISIDSK